ncbi:MAG: DUF1499 domain-containing protein [Pseudomonadota bacterium]
MSRDGILWAGAPDVAALDARFSRSARAGWISAAFSVPVGVLATLFHRTGVIDSAAFTISVASAFLFAIIGLLFAGFALLRIWRVGGRGVARAVSAAVLAALVIAPGAYAVYLGTSRPLLNDVTTDPVLVPQFVVLEATRQSIGASTGYDVEGTWPKQTEGYPQIVPLRLELDFETARTIIDEAIEAEGWQVLQKRLRPDEPRQITIEATATTFIAGFKDDVLVRLSEGADFVRVDMRSASRFGEHDLGANARRIQLFFEKLQASARARTRV